MYEVASSNAAKKSIINFFNICSQQLPSPPPSHFKSMVCSADIYSRKAWDSSQVQSSVTGLKYKTDNPKGMRVMLILLIKDSK